jgi:hypothetical protein
VPGVHKGKWKKKYTETNIETRQKGEGTESIRKGRKKKEIYDRETACIIQSKLPGHYGAYEKGPSALDQPPIFIV